MYRVLEDQAYEVRYGFPPKAIRSLAVAGVFVFGTIALPVDMWTRGLGLALFGGGGLVLLATSLSRKVALRVDEFGITLGGSSLRYKVQTAHVPWRDVEAVVLWRQASARDLLLLGVLRRNGSPPLPGTVGGVAGEVVRAGAESLAAAPDRRLVNDSRPVVGWRLDAEGLATAIRRFGPDVPLIDRR